MRRKTRRKEGQVVVLSLLGYPKWDVGATNAVHLKQRGMKYVCTVK